MDIIPIGICLRAHNTAARTNRKRTGMRVNEPLHIRPVDLEHHTNVVRIVKAKGGKQRRVPLDLGTLAQL